MCVDWITVSSGSAPRAEKAARWRGQLAGGYWIYACVSSISKYCHVEWQGAKGEKVGSSLAAYRQSLFKYHHATRASNAAAGARAAAAIAAAASASCARRARSAAAEAVAPAGAGVAKPRSAQTLPRCRRLRAPRD